MKPQEIINVLVQVQLSSAVVVDNVYHVIDYTLLTENKFGYTNPDTNEEYQVQITEDWDVKDGILVSDEGVHYAFKQLKPVYLL